MIERIVIIDNVDPVTFYGVNNCNMQLIRNLFPKLRIAARGNVIKVIGEDNETSEFERSIKRIEKYVEQYNSLNEETIIDIVKGDGPRELKRDDVIIYGLNGKPITGRTPTSRNSSRSLPTMTSRLLSVRPAPARPTWRSRSL